MTIYTELSLTDAKEVLVKHVESTTGLKVLIVEEKFTGQYDYRELSDFIFTLEIGE